MFLGGWSNIKFGISLHCVPRNDLKPHWLSEVGDCWCHPTEDVIKEDFWAHHALDCRETYEEGRKVH